MPGAGERPVFYLDLTSPECWLVAEEINGVLPVVPVWQPLDVAALPGAARAPAASDRARRVAVERRAAALGLPPVRWPDPFPAAGEQAVRAATFAQASGRVVAFSLAAMRQGFAAGRDLADPDTLLLAAAACELHPRAVLKGIETRAVRDRVDRAHEAAAAHGVAEVPCLRSGAALFAGPSLLEPAARALSGEAPVP